MTDVHNAKELADFIKFNAMKKGITIDDMVRETGLKRWRIIEIRRGNEKMSIADYSKLVVLVGEPVRYVWSVK